MIIKIESGGVPKPSVTWSRDGVRLLSNSRRMLSSTGIRFSEIRESDAGRYTISVKNSAGSSSSSFQLNVNIPPSFTQELPLNLPLRQGDQLRLVCAAEGIPPPKPHFQKICHLIRISNFSKNPMHKFII